MQRGRQPFFELYSFELLGGGGFPEQSMGGWAGVQIWVRDHQSLASFPASVILFFFFKHLFIYLAASGLSCGKQDLSLRRAGFSLVVVLGL